MMTIIVIILMMIITIIMKKKVKITVAYLPVITAAKNKTRNSQGAGTRLCHTAPVARQVHHLSHPWFLFLIHPLSSCI